jgi:hypothetical protein
MARDLILGTAGHIDHGKTSLVKALTGIDCDRLPEEKARGITIAGEFMPGSSFVESQAALRYVIDQWNASTRYADRTYALLDCVFARVADDHSVDVLKGRNGRDWFFAELKGPAKNKNKNVTIKEIAEEFDLRGRGE